MRLLQISDKGAVREPDYPHWNGYVEAFFSAAWGGCRRAAGFAQEVAAQRGIGVFCQAAADRYRNGGVRRGHYWARELRKLGHEVKLMAPQHVKAYVKRNKNDGRMQRRCVRR